MEELSNRTLPQGMTFTWSGISLEEIEAGAQTAIIFGLGLLLVYLTLAAQYESLTLPFIILLSVPLAILGALAAQLGRGGINDVYCQIGLVMLIGLSAQERHPDRRVRRAAAGAAGMSVADAAVEAARIRLRPILMTSLAFILGVMPLVFASGAGRVARNSVGTAVAGGMLASTFLNLLFIPGAVRRGQEHRPRKDAANAIARPSRLPLSGRPRSSLTLAVLLAAAAPHAQPAAGGAGHV